MILHGRYFRNRKADIPNMIYLIVAFFVVALVTIVIWKIFKAIDTDFQKNPSISAEGKTNMSNLKGRYVSVMDNAFLIVVVGLTLAVGIGAWFIRTHPALFWISLPILAFIVFFAAIYANMANNIFTSNTFSTEYNDFPIISFFFNNFVVFITIFVLIISVLLFSKSSESQNEPY